MIKIIINDEQITVKELDEILSKVESNDKNLFYTSIRTSNKEKKSIEHSHFVTARRISYNRYNGGLCSTNTLIGLVRIIGDSTYEYYISEVMVLPEYQGQGIGTKLMKAALNYCKQNGFMKIFLTAAKDREEYYRRFGFKITNYNVMRILNKKLEK
jgi:ribosomal protein S18 acetylase RimI-like enzyme